MSIFLSTPSIVPIQAFFIKFHQDRNCEKSHEQPERLEIATAQGIALGRFDINMQPVRLLQK